MIIPHPRLRFRISLPYPVLKRFLCSNTKYQPHTSPLNKYVTVQHVDSLKPRSIPRYVSNPTSFFKTLVWTTTPSNILVVKKPNQPHVKAAMTTFIDHIHQNYPHCNVIVQKDVIDEILTDDGSKLMQSGENGLKHILFTGENQEIVSKTDLIVSLGGDGTILRGVSMFSNTSVPPVLSFSLGTLGFLLPFNFRDHQRAFKEVYESRASLLKRERLECHVVKKSIPSEEEIQSDTIYKSIQTSKSAIHAMNDIVMHRGSLPSLINLDVYINGNFLTRTTADGLIFATPTGSTAYSLSAGGSIVHPIVQCILLTPICPRSLSFRPVILPSTSHIVVKVRAKGGLQSANTNAKLSIDGMPQLKLFPGDEIHVISESGSILDPKWDLPDTVKFKKINNNVKLKENKDRDDTGIWCVARTKGDWVNGINSLLGFNSGFKSINAHTPEEEVVPIHGPEPDEL